MRKAWVVLLLAGWMSSVAAPVPKKVEKPNYFPCALGSRWEYSTEGNTETALVVVVTGTAEKDGVRTVTITQTFSGKVAGFEMKFRVDREGVHTVSSRGSEFTPPRLDMRPNPKADDSWDSPFECNGTKFKLTQRVGDREVIEVPAGKFTAIPYLSEYRYTGVERSAKQWYAPNIGRVKFQDYDGTVYELLKYTPGKDK